MPFLHFLELAARFLAFLHFFFVGGWVAVPPALPGGGGSAVKVAVTVRFAMVRVTVQSLPAVLSQPDQLVKVEPEAAAALSVT